VLVLRRSQAAMKKLERLVLNRIPFGIIWWLDGHLNHTGPPKYHCRVRWLCDYADWRCFRDFDDEAGERLLTRGSDQS
jgi:hypothetical protein